MAIVFRQKGDFSKLENYLKKSKNGPDVGIFKKYGERGVAALAAATPVDTGKTAASWYYKITRTNGRIALSFYNSNNQNGVPIAIILQYGHATRNGGYVQGRDYINPAIRPVFDQLADEAWKEAKRH